MDRSQPLSGLYTVRLLGNAWVGEDTAGQLWIVRMDAAGWPERVPYWGHPLHYYEQHLDPALQARVWAHTWGWPVAEQHLRCLRCGYEWTPQTAKLPRTCARCNSPYWHRPRRDGQAKEERE